MQSRRYLSKLHSKHKKKFFLRIFKSYTFVFQIIIFSKYFSLFHIFPNILFTALFIIHSLIPHCTILSNTFRIFFLQFFYISLFTLHPLHSYFFFFSNSKHNIPFPQILLYQHDFINVHTSSKYTNFQTRNLHFEMTLSTNFHIAFYLLTTHHPRVINHPLHFKQKKKKKILLYKFSWHAPPSS